jgi:uncharacterized lipoprotein YmbA
MKRRPSIRAVLASSLVLLSLVGCSIKSETAPSRFYMLRPLQATATSPGAPGGESGPVLALGPINIPAYLDRPQIVTQAPGAEVKLSEFDRWAEPLGDNVSAVLANNLSSLLPTDRVSAYPGRLPADLDLRITMDVIRFDGPLGGDVVLEARWSLVSGVDEAVVRAQRSQFVQPAGGPGYADQVEAMSRALDALSRELAQEIRRAAGSN